MKTTNKASTLTRLKSGVGEIIASLALARGLDKAVVEAAFNDAERRGRDRTPGPAQPAGAKLAHKASEGRLTMRHTV